MDREREHVATGEALLVFTVEGSGAFPIDMLRFDGCYPLSEQYDSPRIAATVEDRDLFKRRRVVLAVRPLHGEHWVNITPRRWESFNWKVIGFGEHRGQETEAIR